MRLALALLLALTASPALAAGGKDVFDETCAECHGLGAASTDTPTLKGVVGRKVASLSDFSYSDALNKKQGETWTDANLNAFLTDPQSFAPGTSMTASVPAAADRAAVIAYLKTQN